VRNFLNFASFALFFFVFLANALDDCMGCTPMRSE